MNASPRTRGAARRPEVERIGVVVERLAVLIGAGVAPQQAWVHVAENGTEAVPQRVVELLREGLPVADAIAEAGGCGQRRPNVLDVRVQSRPGLAGAAGSVEAWAVLAAAWHVATVAGAPLSRCLGEIADSLRAVGAVQRDTRTALAGPAATARLVALLPVASLVGGSLLGLDSLRVLFSTPAGLACLVAGLVLMAVGRLWTGRLLRRARRFEPAPGLTLDLVSVAMAGGASTSGAIRLVEQSMTAFGLPVESDSATIGEVLALSERSGAPPGNLLRSEAVRLRRDAVGAASERAAALGVWLMLPLGLCVLPAFMLLAVAPVLIGVLSTTVLGLPSASAAAVDGGLELAVAP